MKKKTKARKTSAPSTKTNASRPRSTASNSKSARTASSARKAAPNTKGFAVFLRGVSPMNLKMPELLQCLEAEGFSDVRTVLSSGNVVFSTRPQAQRSLEKKVEAAMTKHLGRTFLTIVRPIDELQALLDADPYKAAKLPIGAKRVVTFLRQAPKSKLKLPIELDGATILSVQQSEVFSAYVPSPNGPVFMTLIEKNFGQDVTTRTWETVKKVVAKHSAAKE